MIRAWYFYSVWPVVAVVSTAVLLTIPYLALVAFMILALAVIVATAWLALVMPYRILRGALRRLPGRAAVPDPPSVALAPVKSQPSRSVARIR